MVTGSSPDLSKLSSPKIMPTPKQIAVKEKSQVESIHRGIKYWVWEKTLRAWRKMEQNDTFARESVEVRNPREICGKGGVSHFTLISVV